MRFAQVLAAAALTVGLAACGTPEPKPALVAQSETGSYGYAEKELADGVYEVTYESPVFSVPVSSAQRSERLKAERQRAYDFALWRAIDIAKEKGYGAVLVEQDHRDVEVSVRTESSPRLWPGYYGPYRRYPWALYDDDCCWPGYHTYHRWATARARVELRVKFLNEPSEQALDVDETMTRLRARYGTPTYP